MWITDVDHQQDKQAGNTHDPSSSTGTIGGQGHHEYDLLCLVPKLEHK